MGKNIKILACPDCKRKFERLRDLNDHIQKTGHNESKKITRTVLFIAMGLQKILFLSHA